MNQKTEKHIAYLATAIRDLCSIEGPIKDIQAILSHMDSKVEGVPCKELTHNGRIIKCGDEFIIRHLDMLDNPKDVNWLVARTLGHIVLHLGWGTDLNRWRTLPDVKFYINPSSEMFREAELFAMELLLPSDELESMLEVVTGKRDEFGFDELDILGDYFAVPTIKIYQRLLALDVIE